MSSCTRCNKSIGEQDSSRCYGFSCEERLCYQCYEGNDGYCSSCKQSLEKHPTQPDRTPLEKAGRVVDFLTTPSETNLRRELEAYEGEFDLYDDENTVQEMIRGRYKNMPEWKKKAFQKKRKAEHAAMKAYTGAFMGTRPSSDEKVSKDHEIHYYRDKQKQRYGSKPPITKNEHDYSHEELTEDSKDFADMSASELFETYKLYKEKGDFDSYEEFKDHYGIDDVGLSSSSSLVDFLDDEYEEEEDFEDEEENLEEEEEEETR